MKLVLFLLLDKESRLRKRNMSNVITEIVNDGAQI